MDNNLINDLKSLCNKEHINFLTKELKNPGDIYHYSSSNGIFAILDKDELHLTCNSFMNDYSDGKYIQKAIRRFCDRFKDVFEDVFLESIKWYFRDLSQKDIYNNSCGVRVNNNNSFVLSLSYKKDSQNMWSNYSSHEGYCLKFNFEKLKHCFDEAAEMYSEKFDCQVFFTSNEVIYSEEKQDEIIKDTFEKVYNIWNKYGGKYDDVHRLTLEFISNIIGYFDIFKNPLFEEENEYRFIVSVFDLTESGKSQNIIKYKPKNGIIVPYISIPIKSDDGTSPIEAVIIGPKSNIDIAQEGIKFFLGSKKYKNKIEVMKSEMTLRF